MLTEHDPNVFGLCPLAPSLLTVALVIALVTSAWAQAPSKLKVVTTTSDLAALAAEVGGDRIEVETLARGYQDPHFVEPKPSFLLKLHHADLLLLVGLELETAWLVQRFRMPSLITQSGNPRIQVGAPGYFDASPYAEILDVPTPPVTRAMGIHPIGNPHYWLDPENGRRIAQAIATKFAQMRPTDGAYFNRRFDAFSQRLTQKEKAWDEQMRPYHGRKVIAYHRSWSNFLKRFELMSIGEIEPRPGIPPNRHHTRELINLMRHQNVIILVEPYFELKIANRIARETGARVVVVLSSVGGEKEITDYFKLFDYDLELVSKALQAIP